MKPFKYLIVVLTVMTAASALAGIRTDVQMRSAASRVLKSTQPLEQVAYYPGMALYRQVGGGFAIVSSDENKPAILAYSPNGTLKVGSINPFSEPQWGQNPLNPQMWLFYRYRKFTSFSP